MSGTENVNVNVAKRDMKPTCRISMRQQHLDRRYLFYAYAQASARIDESVTQVCVLRELLN